MVRSSLNYIPSALSGVCWLSHVARPRYGRLTRVHSHPEIEVNLIETGTCRYLIDDHVQDLTRGDLFWLFPQQQHMIIEASADLSLWVVLARPEFLARRARRVPDSVAQHPLFACPRRLREAERLHLTSVAASLASREDDPVHHADGLAWWFDEASRLTESQSGRRGRPLHPAVIKSLSLLDGNPSLPLPELARMVHMSASRLSHLFAEQVGRSVAAHRNHVRLQRFRERLQSGECRNLTKAAFEAGFGSYAQFARVLRAGMGVTPRELLAERDS
jgi:AraC-like DNA-binding protein